MMDNPINAAEAYSSDPQRRADYIAGFHAGQRAQTARLFSQAREKVQPIIETEKANEGMPGDSNAHPMTTPTQAERLAGLEGIISELLGLTMQDHMGLAYWMLSNRATLVYQLKEHQKALRQLAAAEAECEAWRVCFELFIEELDAAKDSDVVAVGRTAGGCFGHPAFGVRRSQLRTLGE